MASTISLNFWLNQSVDMISEPNVTESHGFKFYRRYEEGWHCIHTSGLKSAHVIEDITYLRVSAISLNFWLIWFRDNKNVTGQMTN